MRATVFACHYDDGVNALPYYLAFARVRGIGPARLRKLLTHFGSLERAWQAAPFDLSHAGLDDKSVGALMSAQRELHPDRELETVLRAGITALCWDDPGYPVLLKTLNDPPPVLFVRGALLELDQLALAIVGTRKPTLYGREVAAVLAGEMARNSVTVVSGLARGIDAAAHQAALSSGGRTVAVIACGADQVYPPDHRILAERIAEHGAVVSDYPVGSPPEPGNFPPRNRIISGLSLGTVVVEADERSGALITAGFAAEQGRDVFAVPGNIFNRTSRGTNQLLRDGAIPVIEPTTVLQHLNVNGVAERAEAAVAMPHSAEEAHLLERLSHEPTLMDELVRQLGLPTDAVTATLAMLEVRGLVRRDAGASYTLTRPQRRL